MKMRGRAPTEVKVLAEGEGSASAKVDRMISGFKDTQGQTRTVVKTVINLSAATGNNVGGVDFNTLRDEAEFTALAELYRSYRVSGARFVVTDINPALSAANVFGTFHTTDSVPGTLNDVVDLTDSRPMSTGTGEHVFYWKAKGNQELQFTSVDDTVNYGGLAYFVGGVPTAAQKYFIVASFVVDFRARV